ncbi:MAG: bifunctional 2-C-methyl-D-erythritol 4-phosphate cytidylyltransferase/2-C-methyl-D-erythritol 2,4-cyclodiphosphate synthase [Alphaproteobacteria bacterium]|nr:bifunctional 2-C-methyl-D-erythritol 4-phosphate cytidylyltransferase/2-C-methyl-D-erythritol 2,4-cyclodiphosphate synthase [Alphaproteobacteria bacterium]
MSTNGKIDGFHVIVAAAGRGSRFGGDTPKQYCSFGGKTLLRHTLDNILSWPGVLSLRVIIDPEYADSYQKSVSGLDLPDYITGGSERNISINNALNSISNVKDEDIIFIHDAARPFTKAADITALLNALQDNRAATLATPVSDTLRKSSADKAGDIVDRNGLWALQTPQAFRFGDLKKAHEAAENKPYTDDTSLVSALGIEVALVEGARSNIKITTQDDWDMAEALLNQNTRIATGTGFDVHAFEDASSGKPLMLCGIAVEHERALVGHSDADVGLHAITDALLGAIGAGDIGTHFPPSDPTFKDMDSAIFLEKTMNMIAEKGGAVHNIDLTLICEAPKIGPYRDKMLARVAAITGLDQARINIKATTTEKLGFTGRGEGIAAQSIATVQLPV